MLSLTDAITNAVVMLWARHGFLLRSPQHDRLFDLLIHRAQTESSRTIRVLSVETIGDPAELQRRWKPVHASAFQAPLLHESARIYTDVYGQVLFDLDASLSNPPVVHIPASLAGAGQPSSQAAAPPEPGCMPVVVILSGMGFGAPGVQGSKVMRCELPRPKLVSWVCLSVNDYLRDVDSLAQVPDGLLKALLIVDPSGNVLRNVLCELGQRLMTRGTDDVYALVMERLPHMSPRHPRYWSHYVVDMRLLEDSLQYTDGMMGNDVFARAEWSSTNLSRAGPFRRMGHLRGPSDDVSVASRDGETEAIETFDLLHVVDNAYKIAPLVRYGRAHWEQAKTVEEGLMEKDLLGSTCNINAYRLTGAIFVVTSYLLSTISETQAAGRAEEFGARCSCSACGIDFKSSIGGRWREMLVPMRRLQIILSTSERWQPRPSAIEKTGWSCWGCCFLQSIVRAVSAIAVGGSARGIRFQDMPVGDLLHEALEFMAPVKLWMRQQMLQGVSSERTGMPYALYPCSVCTCDSKKLSALGKYEACKVHPVPPDAPPTAVPILVPVRKDTVLVTFPDVPGLGGDYLLETTRHVLDRKYGVALRQQGVVNGQIRGLLRLVELTTDRGGLRMPRLLYECVQADMSLRTLHPSSAGRENCLAHDCYSWTDRGLVCRPVSARYGLDEMLYVKDRDIFKEPAGMGAPRRLERWARSCGSLEDCEGSSDLYLPWSFCHPLASAPRELLEKTRNPRRKSAASLHVVPLRCLHTHWLPSWPMAVRTFLYGSEHTITSSCIWLRRKLYMRQSSTLDYLAAQAPERQTTFSFAAMRLIPFVLRQVFVDSDSVLNALLHPFSSRAGAFVDDAPETMTLDSWQTPGNIYAWLMTMLHPSAQYVVISKVFLLKLLEVLSPALTTMGKGEEEDEQKTQPLVRLLRYVRDHGHKVHGCLVRGGNTETFCLPNSSTLPLKTCTERKLRATCGPLLSLVMDATRLSNANVTTGGRDAMVECVPLQHLLIYAALQSEDRATLVAMVYGLGICWDGGPMSLEGMHRRSRPADEIEGPLATHANFSTNHPTCALRHSLTLFDIYAQDCADELRDYGYGDPNRPATKAVPFARITRDDYILASPDTVPIACGRNFLNPDHLHRQHRAYRTSQRPCLADGLVHEWYRINFGRGGTMDTPTYECTEAMFAGLEVLSLFSNHRDDEPASDRDILDCVCEEDEEDEGDEDDTQKIHIYTNPHCADLPPKPVRRARRTRRDVASDSLVDLGAEAHSWPSNGGALCREEGAGCILTLADIAPGNSPSDNRRRLPYGCRNEEASFDQLSLISVETSSSSGSGSASGSRDTPGHGWVMPMQHDMSGPAQPFEAGNHLETRYARRLMRMLYSGQEAHYTNPPPGGYNDDALLDGKYLHLQKKNGAKGGSATTIKPTPLVDNEYRSLPLDSAEWMRRTVGRMSLWGLPEPELRTYRGYLTARDIKRLYAFDGSRQLIDCNPDLPCTPPLPVLYADAGGMCSDAANADPTPDDTVYLQDGVFPLWHSQWRTPHVDPYNLRHLVDITGQTAPFVESHPQLLTALLSFTIEVIALDEHEEVSPQMMDNPAASTLYDMGLLDLMVDSPPHEETADNVIAVDGDHDNDDGEDFGYGVDVAPDLSYVNGPKVALTSDAEYKSSGALNGSVDRFIIRFDEWGSNAHPQLAGAFKDIRAELRASIEARARESSVTPPSGDEDETDETKVL